MKRINTGFISLLASAMLLLAAPAQAAPARLIIAKPQKMPAISYSSEDGKIHRLKTRGHKLTALHFWATWCVPCVAELPQVDAAQEKYGKDFQVIALSLDGEKTEKVRAFFTEHHIENLAPLFDPDMKAFRTAQVRGLPTTIFINEKGQEIARASGPMDWEDEKVETLITSRILP